MNIKIVADKFTDTFSESITDYLVAYNIEPSELNIENVLKEILIIYQNLNNEIHFDTINLKVDNTKSKHFYQTDRQLDNAKQMEVPEYYIGKEGYEARKVCDNFDLSYHLGTAVTYLLRSKRKHDSPIECLQKAINHIQFEIENYEEKSRS